HAAITSRDKCGQHKTTKCAQRSASGRKMSVPNFQEAETMKKILFAFALVGMFGFAACDKKDEAAKPADTKKDDKGAMKPADSAAKPADTKPADSAAK